MLISFPQAFAGFEILTRAKYIDARYFQLAVLSSLCVTGVVFKGITIGGWQVGMSFIGALLSQYMASKVVTVAFDWRSAAITALSLSILLRLNDPIWALIAAVLAINTKFLIRVRGRHVFNPANAAIVVLLLFDAPVWVSPGQWGSSIYWLFGFAALGCLVLNQTRQLDIAGSFLLSYAGLLCLRALYLGDGWQIPLHQLQNGALLVFAFFMISDPKTIPCTWKKRALFAFVVAALGYILQFHFYIREAIFYALFMVCIASALISCFGSLPFFKKGY